MKASEYRKLKAAKESTTELKLPSGAVFTLRRPPMEVWIAAGKIPQSFLQQMIKGGRGGRVETLSDEDTMASILFVREALLYACVSPRLVVGATGEDELDPCELDPEDFEFLSRWVLSGSPGVAVKTEGGEVSTDDLSRFRQKQPGGRPFSLEPHGAEVREATEPALGVVG